jgi:hypothetical protein
VSINEAVIQNTTVVPVFAYDSKNTKKEKGHRRKRSSVFSVADSDEVDTLVEVRPSVSVPFFNFIFLIQ